MDKVSQGTPDDWVRFSLVSVHADPLEHFGNVAFARSRMYDGTARALVMFGLSLTDVREARQASVEHLPPSQRIVDVGMERSEAYQHYLDFVRLLRNGKRYPLQPKLPTKVTFSRVEGCKHLFTASVSNAPSTWPRGPTHAALSRKEAHMALLQFLASEFADDLATVLQDTVETRLFAYLVLDAAETFRSVSWQSTTPTLGDARREIDEIHAAAEKLASLIANHRQARLLVERAQALLKTEDPEKRSRPYYNTIKIESDASYKARRNVIDWNLFRHQTEFLAYTTDVLRRAIQPKPGRPANRQNNHTPVLLIADAWRASFGVSPTLTTRTAIVFAYCGLLFDWTRPTDVRAGLSYWKRTADARKRLGTKWEKHALELVGVRVKGKALFPSRTRVGKA